jgi:hypothetical protein
MVILSPVCNGADVEKHSNDILLKPKNKPRKRKKGSLDRELLMFHRLGLYKIAMEPRFLCVYDGVFVTQPYCEEYAVCAVVCAAHILNKHLSIEKNNVNDGRWEFERISLEYGEVGWHNENGHYHIDVLRDFLHKLHRRIFIGVKLLSEKFEQRVLELYNALNNVMSDDVYFFMATITLTSRCNIAKKHFICVRTYSDGRAVLLDGLFRGPVLFCMETLLRYIDIGKLYRVKQLK